MKKKILLSLLLSVFMLGSSLTAYAAPQTMADGTVFDAEYYAQNNPDVVAVLGNDANMMYQHYVKYGKTEGRKACADNITTVQLPAKTLVTKKAYTHPISKETKFWISTYSDGSRIRETNKDYYYYSEYPEQYFICRTDFSDGLLDNDENGIDDRDPSNSCGYSDKDYNCVADERQAQTTSKFAYENVGCYHKCSHGVIVESSELCSECTAEAQWVTEHIRFE